MNARGSERGLSIIEMLSSITIIAILAALLFGSIGASYEKTRQAKCINNQHQLINAILLYALDAEQFPTTIASVTNDYLFKEENQTQFAFFAPKSVYASTMSSYYYNQMDILKCPKVKGTIFDDPPVYSYGYNTLVKNANYSDFVDPSQVVVIADSDKAEIGSPIDIVMRHVFGSVAAFADGHVEWIKDFYPTTQEIPEPPGPSYGMTPEQDIIINYNSEIYLLVLGSAVTYGAGGPEVLVNVSLDLDVNGEIQTIELFNSDDVDGGEEFTLGDVSAETILALSGEANYWNSSGSLRFNAEYTSNEQGPNPDESHVLVLKNGDSTYEVDPFDNQTPLSDFLDPYINDGIIEIAENELLILWEFNPSLQSNAADFQDLVVLVTITPTLTQSE